MGGMVDRERYFLNPYIERPPDVCFDENDTGRCPDPVPRHRKPMESPAALGVEEREQCWAIANQLFARCKEQLAAYDRSLSSPSSPCSLGSLYVGPLGPLVYVRYRLALEGRRRRIRSLSTAATSTSISESLECNKSDETVAPRPTTAPQHLDDALLHEALELLLSSTALSTTMATGLVSTRTALTRVSLLEGPEVGAIALYAALLHRTGQTQVAREWARSLLYSLDCATERLPPCECEVLYGRAGALQAIVWLRHELDDPSLGSDLVRKLASHILDNGLRTSSQTIRSSPTAKRLPPLLWVWHNSLYLGAAHGVVGVLHTLLSLEPSEIEDLDRSHNLNALVRSTLTSLETECCFPSGNLDSSIHLENRTLSRLRKDRLLQWCHGAPGHVLLLLQASRVYRRESDLLLAKQLVDQVVWPRGLLKKGVGLCHGIAGNAYAMLELSKFDDTYFDKARCFAKFALERLPELEPQPDRPYSLYEGLAGLALLYMDLSSDRPCDSRFPLYC